MLDLVVHKLTNSVRVSQILTMFRIMQDDCTGSHVPHVLVQLQKEKKEEKEEGEEEKEADDYDFIRSKQVCQSCIRILCYSLYSRCHTVCCVGAVR